MSIIMKLRLPRLEPKYDIDTEIHRYSRDIQALQAVIADMDEKDDNRALLEYNLQIMVLVHQRLLERHE